MAVYRKQFFEKCLKAIVAELEYVEELHPELPGDPFHAAGVLSEKAEQLFRAFRDHGCGVYGGQNIILKEATQTGAMALMVLLAMDNGSQCDVDTYGF